MTNPEIEALVNPAVTLELLEATEGMFDEARLSVGGRLAEADGLEYENDFVQNFGMDTPWGVRCFDFPQSFSVGDGEKRYAEFIHVANQGALRKLAIGSFASMRFLDQGETEDLEELFVRRICDVAKMNEALYRLTNEDREQQAEENRIHHEFRANGGYGCQWSTRGFRLSFPFSCAVACLPYEGE